MTHPDAEPFDPSTDCHPNRDYGGGVPCNMIERCTLRCHIRFLDRQTQANDWLADKENAEMWRRYYDANPGAEEAARPVLRPEDLRGARPMTTTDDISLYALEGRDRDGAIAMLSQSRLKMASPIDDIQVKHLLQIGYRAGRQVTADDTAFERLDTKLGRWTILAGGVAAGAVIAGLLNWLFG